MADLPQPWLLNLLVMALIATAAGVVRGFGGFGAGLVMVPCFGLLIGPHLAVPVVVLLDLAASVQLVPPALRLARWRTIAPLGTAAVLAIPVGSTLLAALQPDPLQRVISLAVLILVAVLSTGWRYRRRPGPFVSAGTGVASGLLTGMAGVGGPPVILFLLSGPDRASHTRANLICYFALTQIVAVGAFVVAGLIGSTVLLLSLILAPFFLLGTFLGTRLFGGVDENLFRRVILSLLALLAVAGLLL